MTPVAGKRKARYSIFGWWLVEGELYSDEESSGSDEEDEQASGSDEEEEEEEEAEAAEVGNTKSVGSARRKPYGRG